MRRNIVAGNWKMNKLFPEADDLINNIAETLREFDTTDVDVIVCPPFVYLELVSDVAEDVDFFVGAQNVSKFDNGAYTGEVSASMLKALGVDYCIVGHSERRKYFGETNQDVAQKINQLLKEDITPIMCVGESLEQRESGKHFDVIKQQVEEGIFHLNQEDIKRCIIAYEPVWAIGTGKTATKEQAQEVHAFIRQLITDKYSDDVAQEISILYGGSCNSKNARELFAMKDVDGGLIGGASLKSKDFIDIACSFE
jgi:triosephosphate isomerase